MNEKMPSFFSEEEDTPEEGNTSRIQDPDIAFEVAMTEKHTRDKAVELEKSPLETDMAEAEQLHIIADYLGDSKLENLRPKIESLHIDNLEAEANESFRKSQDSGMYDLPWTPEGESREEVRWDFEDKINAFSIEGQTAVIKEKAFLEEAISHFTGLFSKKDDTNPIDYSKTMQEYREDLASLLDDPKHYFSNNANAVRSEIAELLARNPNEDVSDYTGFLEEYEEKDRIVRGE